MENRIFEILEILKQIKINLLVFNSKGSMGKTSHAVLLSFFAYANYITNDIDKATLELYKKFLKNPKELNLEEEIEADDEESNIFDFGGFSMDKRIDQVAKFVDWCIVPVCFQSAADLTASIKTIQWLEDYNKNIIILINNTDKEFVESIKEALSNQFKHPIFVISKSKYMHQLANEEKTIFDLYLSGGLVRYQISDLVNQFLEFYSFLAKKKP